MRSARRIVWAGLIEPGAHAQAIRKSQVVEDTDGLLPCLPGGWQVTGCPAGIAVPGQQADQHSASFHALLAAAYRQNYHLVIAPGSSGQLTLEQPTAAELGFTKPEGPADTLPVLKYPTTPSVAVSANAGFIKLENFVLSEINALQGQLGPQVLRLVRHLQRVNPLTRRRTYEILALIGGQYGDPAVKKAWDATVRAQDNIDDFQLQFSGTNPPLPCPCHGTWLSLIQTWDTTIRKYVAAYSRYLAPLVANLSNPVAHQIVLESVRANDDFELTLLVNDVITWTGLEGKCKQQGSMPPPGKKDATAGDPGECPPILAPAHKLVLHIPNLIDIKVDCDSVEVEVEGKIWSRPLSPWSTTRMARRPYSAGSRSA